MRALWMTALAGALMVWSEAAGAAVYNLAQTIPDSQLTVQNPVGAGSQLVSGFANFQPITIFPGDEIVARITFQIPVYMPFIDLGYVYWASLDPASLIEPTKHYVDGVGFDIVYNGHYDYEGIRGPDGALTVSTYNFLITGGVPEPATWMLMLLGFVGLAAAGCRKRPVNGRSGSQVDVSGYG
jgi:hypothetical protein